MGIKISEKDLNDIEMQLELMTKQQLVDGLVSLQRTSASADLVRDCLMDLDQDDLVDVAYNMVRDRLTEVYDILGCRDAFPWSESWSEWSMKETKKRYNF